MSKFWSKTTKEITPYIPGEQPQDKKYIKLNTNENPYPPSPKVLNAIREENTADIRMYPDPYAIELKTAISEYYNVNREEVFVGNGSDEVLAFCFPAFFNQDEFISFPDVTYSFYPVYAKLFGINYTTVPLNDDFTIPADSFPRDVKGIFIANPNAPTGIEMETEAIERLVGTNPDTLFIIDEAYVDFGSESIVPKIKEYDNLLVVQTFSKSRQLAGLRVGLAIGSTGLIEGLERIKNSFNSYTLDRIAQKAAVAAIKDRDYFNETREKIIRTRDKSAIKIRELGFHVLPSKTNFLFISHDKFSGRELFLELRQRGILVRHFQSARIDNWLRVTIGTDEQMSILIDNLRALVV